jgi:hypothetical protein
MKLSRRTMMAGCAGAVTGLLVSGNGIIAAADKWVKPTLWQIEAEALLDALPVQNPAVSVLTDDGRTILILPAAGGTCQRALNDAGRLIWNACDGKHSVEQIARQISRHFDIRREQAYTDCLAFLFHLKMFNAILV